jgi:DNA polymerase I-like protein with 3'-5' exonuclease and polymerase domains
MIVKTLEQFEALASTAPKLVVADTETKGKISSFENLLGVALGWATESGPVFFYVPIHKWHDPYLIQIVDDELVAALRKFLRSKELIGHNVEYDRKWIDASFKIRSAWHCDTRLLWYLLDKHQVERKFGLKTAQTDILGWENRNDTTLEAVVRAAGGSLKKGDHYLAPPDVLGAYAALDAKATLELYSKFWKELEQKDYVAFYRWLHSYQKLLAGCTNRGVVVNLQELRDNHAQLEIDISNLRLEIFNLAEDAIQSISTKQLQEQIEGYKTGRGIVSLLSAPERQKRFNFRSNLDKAKLFYDALRLECPEYTKTGLPKVDKSTIVQLDHPVAKKFVTLAEKEKLASTIKSYIQCIEESPDGLIHFPYNICGTVSGRLSGFKPYALNLPFNAPEAMQPFAVRKGFEGIHSDLRSIEPCFIAAYSRDPILLKVHRDGLGDVYLDFSLVVFPDNQDLFKNYNPNIPVTDAVKKMFKAIRDLCKTAHLAIGFTGTEKTVESQLSKKGFPTTTAQARNLVDTYWNVLHPAVKDLNSRCKQLISKKGHITNPFGRRIIVPPAYRKDTMNRLIQSSAHDALIAWVKEIKREMRKALPEARPLLPDCHDSTSWEIPLGSYEIAKQIFERALRNVSDRLGLPVQLSCETKQFATLYGLKNDEN